MLYIMLWEKWLNESYIASFTTGFDELKNIFSVTSKLQNPVNELIISQFNNEIQIQSFLTYKFIS
jgi:anaerobic selenocysteine-containing dehydrogenase